MRRVWRDLNLFLARRREANAIARRLRTYVGRHSA